MFNLLKKVSVFISAVIISAVVAFISGCSFDSHAWVLKTIRDNYYFYDEMDKEGLDDLSIEEIVKRLDIYSAYYTAEEYEAILKDYSGEKAGIGFSYFYLESGVSSVYPDGGYVVALVMGNSPADKAGLKSGQVLTSGTLNGTTVAFDSAGALDEFISPIAADVKFTFTDGDGADHEVYKTEYNASYMRMATASAGYAPTFGTNGKVNGIEETDGAIEYLPDGFAYVSMSQFFGTAADEFGYLMQKFNAEGCTSLILDLRSNGGGYVDVMCDMAGYFTSSLNQSGYSEAMIAEYKSGKQVVSYAKRHSGDSLVPEDTTVYVLANSGTASASEALIGVLVSYGFLDYENIFLSEYGEEFMKWAGDGYKSGQSYGKGIMQSPFIYWTGEVLKLTTAQIFWPNGTTIHGVGLTHGDGCRLVDAEWIVTPDDSELQRVVEMIKG